MFADYPDVIDVNQLMDMLHIGRNKAYEILNNGEIKFFKIGKKFRITKESVIDYVSKI